MKSSQTIYNQIIEMIPTGKTAAIHLTELTKRFNVSDKTINDAIRTARNNGIPICSGVAGYWKAESKAEFTEFEKMMRGQALTRFKSLKGVRNTVYSDPDQVIFDGGGDV